MWLEPHTRNGGLDGVDRQGKLAVPIGMKGRANARRTKPTDRRQCLFARRALVEPATTPCGGDIRYARCSHMLLGQPKERVASSRREFATIEDTRCGMIQD